MSEGEPTPDVGSLVEEAEQQKEQFNEARERLQEVRSKLRESVGTLYEEGTISDEERERIGSMIDNGDYGKARDAIETAAEGDALAFEDEEKDQFARAFETAWEDLAASVEEIRTALLELRAKNQMDEDDLVDYLYGKHHNLKKGDIRAVMDAFGEIEMAGLSERDMARVLAAFNSDLNITTAEDVLAAIDDEVDR